MNRKLKYSMRNLLLLASCLFVYELHAQGISINNTPTAANAAAMLDVSSGTGVNMGMLIPRVTYAQRNGNFNPLLLPAQGLMVYQTDAGTLGEGLYYNTSTTTTPNWVKAGAIGWSVDGNIGTVPGTNFLGTTDANGIDFRTNNAIAMSILSGGNVGIGGTAPGVKLTVGGNGGNVYGTDLWVENNLHVQGNEGVGGGRGRLRIGTKSGYVGLYADPNSLGANNDLVIGAGSGVVRIGPGSAGQKLVLPASTSFQLVDGGFIDRVLRSDASGNGTWEQLGTIMQVYTVPAQRTLINSYVLTQITGLSQTIVLTQNSYVILRTTGNLESSSNFAGGASATIEALQMNGVSLQEQGTDMIYTLGANQTTHWEIYHNLVLTPGTYTFTVGAKLYCPGCTNFAFYAGGTTIAGLTNSGNLTVRVIPQ